MVSVSAGSGGGSPCISYEWPADSLRFAAIHFRSRRAPRSSDCTGLVDGDGRAAPCVSVAYTTCAFSGPVDFATAKFDKAGMQVVNGTLSSSALQIGHRDSRSQSSVDKAISECLSEGGKRRFPSAMARRHVIDLEPLVESRHGVRYLTIAGSHQV